MAGFETKVDFAAAVMRVASSASETGSPSQPSEPAAVEWSDAATKLVLATVKDWPVLITIVDMIWGTALSVAVSYIGFMAGKWLN